MMFKTYVSTYILSMVESIAWPLLGTWTTALCLFATKFSCMAYVSCFIHANLGACRYSCTLINPHRTTRLSDAVLNNKLSFMLTLCVTYVEYVMCVNVLKRKYHCYI